LDQDTLTRPGRFLLVVVAISAFLEWIRTKASVYQVFTFAARCDFSFLTGLAAPAAASGPAVQPGSGMAGERIMYRLTIRNLDNKQHSGPIAAEKTSGGTQR